MNLVCFTWNCKLTAQIDINKTMSLFKEKSGYQVGSRWGRVPPAKYLPKIWKKRETIGEKKENRDGSFTLPLLTDRAGYATVYSKIQSLTTPLLKEMFYKLYKYTVSI